MFITNHESTCDECGENLGRKAWITLQGKKGAACLTCADLDHLVFLPAGDATLTRRSRKHSRLSAVVLKWSKPRKRYERQGLLVESKALEQAEKECKADMKQREVRRMHAAIRREELDEAYIKQFSSRISIWLKMVRSCFLVSGICVQTRLIANFSLTTLMHIMHQ